MQCVCRSQRSIGRVSAIVLPRFLRPVLIDSTAGLSRACSGEASSLRRVAAKLGRASAGPAAAFELDGRGVSEGPSENSWIGAVRTRHPFPSKTAENAEWIRWLPADRLFPNFLISRRFKPASRSGLLQALRRTPRGEPPFSLPLSHPSALPAVRRSNVCQVRASRRERLVCFMHWAAFVMHVACAWAAESSVDLMSMVGLLYEMA